MVGADGLTLIGYWSGPHTDPTWPNVEDFVDRQWDVDERYEVSHYLTHGLVKAAMMGFSLCRLCGVRNGNLLLTDTVFVWPEGLAHYVVEHGVRPPGEFVQHATRFSEELFGLPISDAWWRSATGTGET